MTDPQEEKQSVNYSTGVSSVADAASRLLEIPPAAGWVCEGFFFFFFFACGSAYFAFFAFCSPDGHGGGGLAPPGLEGAAQCAPVTLLVVAQWKTQRPEGFRGQAVEEERRK